MSRAQTRWLANADKRLGPMKFQTSEQTAHAAAVAMNDMKGKPRSEGYPTSERSKEFKGGMMWSTPAGGFSNAWETGKKGLTNAEDRATARATRT